MRAGVPKSTVGQIESGARAPFTETVERLVEAAGAARIVLICTTRAVPGRPPTIDYHRHQPEKTLLYEVVRENLETFLSSVCEQGAPVSRSVEREIRAYLDRVVRIGPARLSCLHQRVPPFIE